MAKFKINWGTYSNIKEGFIECEKSKIEDALDDFYDENCDGKADFIDDVFIDINGEWIGVDTSFNFEKHHSLKFSIDV